MRVLDRAFAIVLALASLVAAPLAATRLPAQEPPAGAQSQQPLTPAERQQLEDLYRRQLAQVVRDRLQLDDNQFKRLVETNQRFEQQRRPLVQQEIDIRRQLRQEQLSPSPNQQRVSELLDRQLQLEQQRIAITQAEQRELSGFLTPVQRVRYAALQEQIRRRLQALRQAQIEKQPLTPEERQERKQERQGRPPLRPRLRPR